MTLLDECWVWNGYADKDGYGQKKINRRPLRIHRLAWAWANWNGEGDWKAIPAGMQVCHHCDNPPCVNPKHLFLGTTGDNTRDMVRKGRQHHQKKTHCPQGHPYSGTNLYVYKGQQRMCKACHLAGENARSAAIRAAR